MAGLRSNRALNRGNRGVVDHDIMEGLPIRQWRKQGVVVGTKPPKEEEPVNSNTQTRWRELPMPRGSELYSSWSQALLRAARRGNICQPYGKQPDEDKDNVEEEKAAPEPLDAGFKTTKWALVPKDQEQPEIEFLAKRRKGLPSLHGETTGGASQVMRKVKIKKVDADGNAAVFDVLAPEGAVVEGEIVKDAEVPTLTPAPGTIVEGVGVANEEGVVVATVETAVPTPPRRMPPRPKRKAKGPGRGRKKRQMLSSGATEGSPSLATGERLTVPGMGGDAASGTDVEMGDDTATKDGEDGSDDEDDDGEDREDGDASDMDGPTRSVSPMIKPTETKSENATPVLEPQTMDITMEDAGPATHVLNDLAAVQTLEAVSTGSVDPSGSGTTVQPLPQDDSINVPADAGIEPATATMMTEAPSTEQIAASDSILAGTLLAAAAGPETASVPVEATAEPAPPVMSPHTNDVPQMEAQQPAALAELGTASADAAPPAETHISPILPPPSSTANNDALASAADNLEDRAAVEALPQPAPIEPTISDASAPVPPAVAAPILDTVLEPVPEPAAGPTEEAHIERPNENPIENLTEPAVDPPVEPPTAPAAEPALEYTAQPIIESAAELAAGPAAGPAAEPAAVPAAVPTAEPADKPAAEPAAEPVAEPAAEPHTEPAAERAAEPATELEVQPATEPASESTAEPTGAPVDTSAEAHVEPTASDPAAASTHGSAGV